METFEMCDMILYLLDFKLPKVNPIWIDRAAFDSISATGYKIESNSAGSVQKNDKIPLLLPEKASNEYFVLFFHNTQKNTGK